MPICGAIFKVQLLALVHIYVTTPHTNVLCRYSNLDTSTGTVVTVFMQSRECGVGWRVRVWRGGGEEEGRGGRGEGGGGYISYVPCPFCCQPLS